MRPLPYEKMICDSDMGDGGVYFYDEYFEWLNRSNGEGFRIHYKDVDEVKILSGVKKTVIITTKGGETKRLYLYKADTLQKLIFDGAKRAESSCQSKVVDVEPVEVDNEDTIAKLERLAKLHESGALSDEEFAKAKEKVLG